MSKDIETVAPYKTEAMYRFVQVLDIMGYRDGKTAHVAIIKATSGHDDTVRVTLSTEVGNMSFTGEMVLKTYDGQWQLYCAASHIRYGEEVYYPEDYKGRWDIFYDYDEQVLGVRKFWEGSHDEELRFPFAPVKANKTTHYLVD